METTNIVEHMLADAQAMSKAFIVKFPNIDCTTHAINECLSLSGSWLEDVSLEGDAPYWAFEDENKTGEDTQMCSQNDEWHVNMHQLGTRDNEITLISQEHGAISLHVRLGDRECGNGYFWGCALFRCLAHGGTLEESYMYDDNDDA